MLSRMSLKWKWFDWLFVAIAVIIVVGAIRVVAPTSGLSQALHQGFHALAVGLQWIANGLSALAHAQLALQDDETGLQALLENMYAFYEPLEPPVTRSWTRVRGSLLDCVEKLSDTYCYTPQEDQGGHDWRVLVLDKQHEHFERRVFTPQQLLERIKHHPDATRAAIVDFDTAWFGETIKVDWTDGQTGPDLWVHAKLYLLGNNEPLALVYRIDFEEFEDFEESEA